MDFKRTKDGIPAKVERIEYDPNRTANIALLLYENGQRDYIIAHKSVVVGSVLKSGSEAPIQAGNCLPLRNIPVGSVVHCVEMKPGKGAQMARSAGTYARIMAKENNLVTLKLPSGEVFCLDKNKAVRKVEINSLFENQKVIMFGLPGAFTSVCSAKHLPGFIKNY